MAKPLYHFTRAENLPSIRKHGLVPRALLAIPGHEHRKVVWLTLDPSPMEGQIRLTVRLPEFDPRLIYDLEPPPHNIAARRLYLGIIPPDKIEFPS